MVGAEHLVLRIPTIRTDFITAEQRAYDISMVWEMLPIFTTNPPPNTAHPWLRKWSSGMHGKASTLLQRLPYIPLLHFRSGSVSYHRCHRFFPSAFAIIEGQLEFMEGVDEVEDVCRKIVDSTQSDRRHIFEETRDSDSPFQMWEIKLKSPSAGSVKVMTLVPTLDYSAMLPS